MTVSLLRDPAAAALGPTVAALVFCGEDAGEGGEGGEEMEHDGINKNEAVISLSHAGLVVPGDTIPGGAENEEEGGLLRGHGTRAGGIDLVAAATAAATAAAAAPATAGGDGAGGGASAPAASPATASRGLFATVAGQVSRVDRLVRVSPAALPPGGGPRYSADVGDVVVGRVVEVSGKRWRVDLGGKHDAALALSAVSLPPVASGGGTSAAAAVAAAAAAAAAGGEDEQLGEEDEVGGGAPSASFSPAFSAAVARRRGAEDEAAMRDVLREGDLLSAEVQAVHASDGSLLLHARSSKYGKLMAPGCLVRLPASSVGRQRQQFNELRTCGVSVILGVNGWVWVSPFVGERQAGGGGGAQAAAAAASAKLALDGRRAVAVAAAALRALSSLGIAVTPRSIERAVGVASSGNFAPSSDLEEEYLLAVARAERGAR